MTNDYFNNLSPEQVSALQEAAKHKNTGWDSKEYQAAYLAYHTLLKGEEITRNKFDAIVRYWNLHSHSSKDWGHMKHRRGYTRVPNKMMTNTGNIEKHVIYGSRDEILEEAKQKALQSAAEAESRQELKAIYKGNIYRVKSFLAEV
jgi:hypothetical protein